MTSSTNSTVPTAVRRYEWVAFEAIWVRELTLFRRYWASSTFSAIVQPTIYLLAFGLGVGTLISSVDGLSYVEYVGTGTVAMAVLFASAFPGMFSTFVRRTFQHSYDALLAAPVDIEELVLAEGTWIAAKAGAFDHVHNTPSGKICPAAPRGKDLSHTTSPIATYASANGSLDAHASSAA